MDPTETQRPRPADCDSHQAIPLGVESTDETAIPWFVRHLYGNAPLTAELEAVIKDIISPLYAKMVLEEPDPILRAAGNAVVIAYTLAVLEQPRVIEAASQASAGDDESRSQYNRIVSRFQKTARESSRTMNLHLSLRRAKYAPWVVPTGPGGMVRKHGCGI